MISQVTQEFLGAAVMAAMFASFLFLYKVFIFSLTRIFARTHSDLDNRLLRAINRPATALFILFGVYSTLHQVPPLVPHNASLSKMFVILATLCGAWTGVRVVKEFLEWYGAFLQERSAAPLNRQFVPLLRKALSVLLWSMAGLLVLDILGYKITPLLTSLGIGGLAVALALQDTLSNFFAGFYIMADQPVRVGDYIKLQTGEEGTVLEIGWRSTRIQTLSNNTIIIPNSKLSGSHITNYALPDQEAAVLLQCGVSYASDLKKVEKVTDEVARMVQQTTPGAVENFIPFIRYHTFGDSNIEFTVILRAKSYVAQYLLKHEFIKELHARYRQENIEIAFPRRVVHLKTADSRQ